MASAAIKRVLAGSRPLLAALAVAEAMDEGSMSMPMLVSNSEESVMVKRPEP